MKDDSTPGYPIEALIEALGQIRFTVDPRRVRVKSADRLDMSPILSEDLAGRLADIVVSPASVAELRQVMAAAARLRIPIVPRAAGTCNYGQSVPLRGGIVLDLLGLSGILELGSDRVRVLAGTVMAKLDKELRTSGKELRFIPSTAKMATVGGNFGGGIGGIGSLAHGCWSDPGNLISCKVMTMEEEPREIELEGLDVLRPFHTYGATGVVTEMVLPLAPAWAWQETLVAFDDFPSAARFAADLARAYAITAKLASVQEWPIGRDVHQFAPHVPEGSTVLLAMIADHSWPAFAQWAAERGGRVLARAPEGEGPWRLPMWEFAFGHLIQNVQRKRPKATVMEGFVSGEDMDAKIARAHELCRCYGPMFVEFLRLDGRLQGLISPFFDFESDAQAAEVTEALRRAGVMVRNPHTTTVRAVGKKRITGKDIAFKRETDPHGLMNPGRFEPDEADDAQVGDSLPTDRHDRGHG
ncbi:FAD-binding oxidoreductase [Mangrovicoccus ximenensis]|uniref:FAD-binding oxidoreductase n=1 Tax=Mangrovicoccus ximenensis TaxID=1911570 RepID=UPI000D38DA5E|nr:FAD-binding oxidoreductase [Mangrovicoccus ximenensis]